MISTRFPRYVASTHLTATSHHDSKNKTSVRVGQRRAENRVNQVGAVYTALTTALQKCCRGELWRNDRKALLQFVCRSSPSFIYMYIFVAYKSHVAGHSFWCRNVLQSKHCTLIRAERAKIRSRSPIYLKLSSYDHHPLIILLLCAATFRLLLYYFVVDWLITHIQDYAIHESIHRVLSSREYVVAKCELFNLLLFIYIIVIITVQLK